MSVSLCCDVSLQAVSKATVLSEVDPSLSSDDAQHLSGLLCHLCILISEVSVQDLHVTFHFQLQGSDS